MTETPESRAADAIREAEERGRMAGLKEAEQIAAEFAALDAPPGYDSFRHNDFTRGWNRCGVRLASVLTELQASPTDEKQGQPSEESGRQSAIHRSTVHVWNEVNGEDYCNRCGILAAHGQSGTDCQGYIPLDRLCLLAAPASEKET